MYKLINAGKEKIMRKKNMLENGLFTGSIFGIRYMYETEFFVIEKVSDDSVHIAVTLG